ncbi:hypothetical protein JCM11251_006488 [Rhodosporidiobolus azoricus]
MQASRLSALQSYFSAILSSRFDDIPAHFAPDAVWQVGPPSFVGTLPTGGKLGAQEVVETVKWLRTELLVEAKPVDINQVIHGEESLAARVTVHGTTRDKHSFDMQIIFLIDFQPDTALFKSVNETIDSGESTSDFLVFASSSPLTSALLQPMRLSISSVCRAPLGRRERLEGADKDG